MLQVGGSYYNSRLALADGVLVLRALSFARRIHTSTLSDANERESSLHQVLRYS